MFTRTHYKAIAAIVNIDYDQDCNEYGARVDMAEKLADYFASDNPRFDRERFLTACGVEVETVETVTDIQDITSYAEAVARSAQAETDARDASEVAAHIAEALIE